MTDVGGSSAQLLVSTNESNDSDTLAKVFVLGAVHAVVTKDHALWRQAELARAVLYPAVFQAASVEAQASRVLQVVIYVLSMLALGIMLQAILLLWRCATSVKRT